MPNYHRKGIFMAASVIAGVVALALAGLLNVLNGSTVGKTISWSIGSAIITFLCFAVIAGAGGTW